MFWLAGADVIWVDKDLLAIVDGGFDGKRSRKCCQ